MIILRKRETTDLNSALHNMLRKNEQKQLYFSGNTVKTEKLKTRMNLIQRYIDHNEKLELQALYAVQALVHKLAHPAGKCYILLAFYSCLFHFIS